MPYKNIVFAKLEKRLLNDHRWFTMSENAQLIYIKLILIAQDTYNQIPKNAKTLSELCRFSRPSRLIKCIEEIKNNFPKFQENANFYYFEDFHEKTNYLKDFLRQSSGNPQAGVEKEKEKEEEKEKNVERLLALFNSALYVPKLLEIEFIQELYERFGYDKSKIIIRKFAAGKFHKVDTMRESLNPDGTIKPKQNKNEDTTTVKWNPA